MEGNLSCPWICGLLLEGETVSDFHISFRSRGLTLAQDTGACPLTSRFLTE